MKISSLKKEVHDQLKMSALSFPVGMQLANVMIEDRTFHSSEISESKRKESSDHNSLPYYKNISRFINPELL